MLRTQFACFIYLLSHLSLFCLTLGILSQESGFSSLYFVQKSLPWLTNRDISTKFGDIVQNQTNMVGRSV